MNRDFDNKAERCNSTQNILTIVLRVVCYENYVDSQDMDPFSAVFHDVHKLILQHFKANDVLIASTVSKSWYEVIGANSHCMQQIWVTINQPWHQADVLIASSRRYENFKINAGNLKKLTKAMRNFRPRIAVIQENDYEDYEEYCSFLRSMAPTIEILHPSGDAKMKNTDRVKLINFPKLRELQSSVFDPFFFNVFLGDTSKLKKVLLSFDNGVTSNNSALTSLTQQFFVKNSQIEHLWLFDIDCIFINDISANVKLKLKSLAFGKNGKLLPQVRTNFLTFFKNQRCLELLKIMNLSDSEMFLEMWKQENFKRIEFVMDCNMKGALNNVELSENSRVREINFYLSSSGKVLEFLRASPNITSFRVRQLSLNILSFCIDQLQKLELIQCQSCENDSELNFTHLIKLRGRKIRLEILDFFEFVECEISRSF